GGRADVAGSDHRYLVDHCFRFRFFVGRPGERAGESLSAREGLSNAPRRRRSAADLRQRQKSAGAGVAAADEIVAFRLYAERVFDEGPNLLAPTERPAQVGLDAAEQARPEPAVGGQPHTVAALAVVVAHGRDDAYRAARAREPEVHGRA